MTSDSCDTVVFDLGGVLIDRDPRHLYRSLFHGDHAAMERFLSEVCTPTWNQQQDAGRLWAEAVAVVQKQFPEYDGLIRACCQPLGRVVVTNSRPQMTQR